jgi:hypothetical protein
MRFFQNKVFILLACVIAFGSMHFFGASSAQARSWSGQVLDIRTGQPVSGVNVKAGISGRVDPFPGYLAVTGENGRFSITWPEESWNNWNAGSINHYLRIDVPARQGERWGDYWQVIFIRASPAQDLIVELIPRYFFIKGQVLGLGSLPLANANVFLGRRERGAVSSFGHGNSVRTDTNGYFSFTRQVAYPADVSGWPTGYYDIPPGLSPIGSENFANLLQDVGPTWEFAVGVQFPGDTETTWHVIPEEETLSSFDDSLHAYVLMSAGGEWTDREKADRLFDWVEFLVPALLPPGSRTVESGSLIYRYYSTGVFLATFLGDLYFINQEMIIIPLGTVDSWLPFVQNS